MIFEDTTLRCGLMPLPDDYFKWYKWAYEERYGEGSWEKEGGKLPKNLVLYRPRVKKYWDDGKAIGVLEYEGKYIGVACLAAKEVTNRESYIKRFGLSFEKDVQWHAVASLLDHLTRSPMFKAVLITTRKIPFKLEPDIPEEVKGKLRWVERNYQFHRDKADILKRHIEEQEATGFLGVFPKYLPKQMKEEESHARYFLEAKKSLMRQVEDRMRRYFTIKNNLFATALFFYIYTDEKDNLEDALREIEARKYSVKMEIVKTYFVKCSDVRDPIIVFNPEFFPHLEEAKKYYCLSLAKDCVGFSCDKDVAIALKHMFTSVLELPKEIEIKEEIHIPGEEVSLEGPRKAFLGYIVSSIIKKKVKKKRVYFPLDILTAHAIIFGKTRIGKSFLSLILIQEALNKEIKVVVFDPHGTLANKLKSGENLEIYFFI